MRPFLFFLLTLSISLSISAQEIEKADSSFNIQLFSGLDFYSTEINGEQSKPIARPSIGFSLERRTKSSFTYALGVQYFRRAARYSPSVRLEEAGLELIAGPRYRTGDFAFFVNGVYSTATTRAIEKRTESDYYSSRPELSPYSAIRIQLGAEMKLMPQLNLFMNRSIVLDGKNSYVNQFGLRYTFGNSSKTPTYRRIRKDAASRQIVELSEGVLLIRLKNPEASFEAMRKAGRADKADKLESKIDEQNRAIRSAFASEYNFSKVYFFFSQHSDSVSKGKLDGILYDENFNLIRSTDSLEDLHIFTAEFGEVGQDTLRYYDYESYRNGESAFSNKPTTHYYGGTEMSFDALVISDREFNQLSRPFPYYSRWIKPAFRQHPEIVILGSPLIVFLNYNIETSVRRLNKRLHRYYNRQIR